MPRQGHKNRFTISITGTVTLTASRLVTLIVLVLIGLGTWYQR